MTQFFEENFNFQLVSQLARSVFDFDETVETNLLGSELSFIQNFSPQISTIQNICNILPQDGSGIKDTIVEGLFIQDTFFHELFHLPQKYETYDLYFSSLPRYLDNWEAIGATENPNRVFKIGNIPEPIRIGRFFQALPHLFFCLASISPQRSLQLDTFSDGNEQNLPVLFSLLASVGQYTINKSKTFKRDSEWSRSAASNTRADTYLQCTQCPMRIALSDLFQISSLKPTTHTAKLLGKLAVQHDAECTSRFAIHRLRLEEARHPVEEAKLESSMKSIGIYEYFSWVLS